MAMDLVTGGHCALEAYTASGQPGSTEGPVARPQADTPCKRIYSLTNEVNAMQKSLADVAVRGVRGFIAQATKLLTAGTPCRALYHCKCCPSVAILSAEQAAQLTQKTRGVRQVSAKAPNTWPPYPPQWRMRPHGRRRCTRPFASAQDM